MTAQIESQIRVERNQLCHFFGIFIRVFGHVQLIYDQIILTLEGDL
jgi:hypothetical protein